MEIVTNDQHFQQELYFIYQSLFFTSRFLQVTMKNEKKRFYFVKCR